MTVNIGIVATRRNFPVVFNAFQTIDYDNGAVTRDAPERTFYTVPAPWDETLADAERWLGTLSLEDLYEFCTGEESEVAENFLHNPGLLAAHNLLNAYFEDFA